MDEHIAAANFPQEKTFSSRVEESQIVPRRKAIPDKQKTEREMLETGFFIPTVRKRTCPR